MPIGKKQVLVADDEANLRKVLAAMLARDGYEAHLAANGQEAIELLGEHHIDTVICDLKMPKVDGLGVLRHVVDAYPRIPVILITAHGTVDSAVEALKLGAFDYITKPFEREELRHVVAKALKTADLADADIRLDGAEAGRYRIIGHSPRMQEIYAILERVADSPSTVLLTGESGTGKELIARALHENSSRKEGRFIAVNCAAIPKDLMESELFGYEKGAFTGAVTSKPGRFELADGGTLFLDEIGEIPVEMQVKLLRALQESEFERVGGVKTIRVDVRLIASTNRELEKQIEVGTFREDLYYRINVVHIHLPPLRERREDIPLLVDHFRRRYNERLKKNVSGLEDSAMERLLSRPWPGNIRQLENVVERCVLFCNGDKITEADLPPEHPTASPEPAAAPISEATSLRDAVREASVRVERELIVRALKQTSGNVTHAARILKISRKGLQVKMKELGLREKVDEG
jgi:two-component system, NtrC family, response regulator AtoC